MTEYPNKLSKDRPIYFNMDLTVGGSGDTKIMNTVVNKLKSAGLTVKKQNVDPNGFYQNMVYVYNQNLTNAVMVHLFNGVDPSNIREIGINGNDNRGRKVRERGNDVILAWFYDACDFTRSDGTCYNSVRASETGASMSNPLQYCKDNKIYAVNQSSNQKKNPERADYTGEKVADAIIALFDTGNSNDTNSDTSTISDTNSNTSTTSSTTSDEKQIASRTTTKSYSIANYQNVMKVKTDSNGAFKINPLLPYRGEYTVTMKFAGDKTHNNTTKTIKIYNYSNKSSIFNETLLNTKTVTKYTDGTTSTTDSGGKIPDELHIKRVITTETYNNGKVTNINERTVIVDNILVEAPETPEDNTTTTQKNSTTSTTSTTSNGKINPFKQIVNSKDGVPAIAKMTYNDKEFQNINLNNTYTLSLAQFKEVYNRDSQMMQLHGYKLSNYTAFQCEDNDYYNVIRRTRWNIIVESIHYYMVKHTSSQTNPDTWPIKFKIDFPNRRTYMYTTEGGEWINWKGGQEVSYVWFCADDQDWGATCGPTSASVCTQVLMNYYSENKFRKYQNIGSGGSGPEQIVKMFTWKEFTASTYSGKTTALSELDNGRPTIWHINWHYVCLAQGMNNRMLVCNSAADNGNYSLGGKLNTGWTTTDNISGQAGLNVRVALNWTLSEEKKEYLRNFFVSMGGAWSPQGHEENVRKI